ncbi:two-component system sensor histidine kinase KdpD [Knoellia remsis]|uniref:histidine kinase n=1 Tax=Knoellia remsis TaxID=407159 RepID=A0A2T0U9T9_9MICO|nr:DUF4118 domain-containing protein [Knoellia remsis]PRY54703.1 two-component system sensor histidine kinase KdpD [Knoellia remsis]
MTRGVLRVYLGSAPGVGKTVAMLAEAQRRLGRGTDVVIGVAESHGRAHTARLMEGIETLPRREVGHRGATLTELDVAAVLARRPEVVLVDELAHTNAPGSPHEKRWQDVDEILDAGIDVISTVNIQHLESLGDVVEAITGIRQLETVPDEFVRSADQVELVDMSPEALRRRLAHGNVYAAEKVDAALANYFRVGNLTALRELSLLWVADRVDEAMARYREAEGIDRPWPTRERVVVALTGGPEGRALLRRGAQIASRGAGGELIAVHVTRSDGLVAADLAELEALERLTVDLGGTFHTVRGDDTAAALLAFARGVNARQVVVGASRRRRWQELLSPGVGQRVVEASGDIDVHLVSHDLARTVRAPLRFGPELGVTRTALGWGLALLGVPLAGWLLWLTTAWHDLPLEVLIFLFLTVCTALLGGVWPALAASVLASLVINWFFTEPLYTLTIADPQNLVALVVFLLVAVAVSSVVHVSERRAAAARSAQREAAALAASAESLLGEEDQLQALLRQCVEFFGVSSAAIVSRESARAEWTVVAATAGFDVAGVRDAAVRATVDDTRQLVLVGGVPTADDRRLVSAFTTRAAAVLHRAELVREASRARALAKDNRARTALLAAVSHDLRTPLAAIKAASSSLRASDVTFSVADREDLLETVEESADRLAGLVANLLDMSRLQSGAVTARIDAVSVADAVVDATAQLDGAGPVRSTVSPDGPLVAADRGLLERVLANVLQNAVRHWSGEVVVTSAALADRVQMRIVDRGPGVPRDGKERIFEPFQRVGDTPGQGGVTGVGLGLAVARGLMEAMDGAIWAEDTPGGGLTVVLELPRTEPVRDAAGSRRWA